MDFNNIKSRLERIYSSINKRFEEDHGESIKVETKGTDKGKIVKGTTFKVSFDRNKKESDTLNKVFLILHNLANLKDHLKNILNKRADDPQVIEKEINNSIYLQVVLDLSNQEKHGYPLTKTRRSLKDPLIKNIQYSMLVTAGLSSFSIDLLSGQSKTANCPIVIDADIFDSKGNHMFRLDELIDNAMADWEAMIKKFKIS